MILEDRHVNCLLSITVAGAIMCRAKASNHKPSWTSKKCYPPRGVGAREDNRTQSLASLAPNLRTGLSRLFPKHTLSPDSDQRKGRKKNTKHPRVRCQALRRCLPRTHVRPTGERSYRAGGNHTVVCWRGSDAEHKVAHRCTSLTPSHCSGSPAHTDTLETRNNTTRAPPLHHPLLRLRLLEKDS